MRTLPALWLLLLPLAAVADYKSDYREGVIAAERQDWAKVESLMRRAIAEQPAPDPQARIRMYGQRFIPYVPYFYLGLAAFSRGDCATAVTLFEDSRHAGALAGLREAERQAMMLRSCRAKLGTAVAAAPPAAQPAAAPPKPAQTAAPQQTPPPRPAAVAPAKPAAATPAAAAPAPLASFDTSRAQAAQARLDRVDAALASSARTLDDAALADVRGNWQRQLEPLTGQSRQARARLNAARQERDGATLGQVESMLAGLESAAQKLAQGIDDARIRTREVALADARTALERLLVSGDRQLAGASDRSAPEAQALAKALVDGRASLGATDGARLQGAARAIEAASRVLDATQARQALAAQVRGRLQPLAESFLTGDFARAAQWADEQALQAVPQALAQALLLRAAARHELYVLGGERDLDQFDRIRDDVRAARQAWGAITPSERAYSPRFRALFASTR
jgi:hypothetical protein